MGQNDLGSRDWYACRVMQDVVVITGFYWELIEFIYPDDNITSPQRCHITEKISGNVSLKRQPIGHLVYASKQSANLMSSMVSIRVHDLRI